MANVNSFEHPRALAEGPIYPLPEYAGMPPLPSITQVDPHKYRGPTEESNWVIYGKLLVGAYPSAVHDETNDEILTSILRLGCTTFVCLQQEYQHEGVKESEWRSGEKLRPYIFDAIRLVDRLPPSIFPTGRKPAGLEFIHFPIVDCSIAHDASVLQLAKDLCQRLLKGEVMYLHCWGGHGRTGTVISIMLGLIYGLSATDAMHWVQYCHDMREYHMDTPSPQTLEQREQVINILNGIQQLKMQQQLREQKLQLDEQRRLLEEYRLRERSLYSKPNPMTPGASAAIGTNLSSFSNANVSIQSTHVPNLLSPLANRGNLSNFTNPSSSTATVSRPSTSNLIHGTFASQATPLGDYSSSIPQLNVPAQNNSRPQFATNTNTSSSVVPSYGQAKSFARTSIPLQQDIYHSGSNNLHSHGAIANHAASIQSGVPNLQNQFSQNRGVSGTQYTVNQSGQNSLITANYVNNALSNMKSNFPDQHRFDSSTSYHPRSPTAGPQYSAGTYKDFSTQSSQLRVNNSRQIWR